MCVGGTLLTLGIKCLTATGRKEIMDRMKEMKQEVDEEKENGSIASTR
jgi:hypothetical protein